jgi:hypothetical protein
MPKTLNRSSSLRRGELLCVHFKVLLYSSSRSHYSSPLYVELVHRPFVDAAKADSLSIVAPLTQESTMQLSYDVGCQYTSSPPCPKCGVHGRNTVALHKSTNKVLVGYVDTYKGTLNP